MKKTKVNRILASTVVGLTIALAACQAETVEVTRVVEVEIEGEVVEVTRVVTETEVVTETVTETEIVTETLPGGNLGEQPFPATGSERSITYLPTPSPGNGMQNNTVSAGQGSARFAEVGADPTSVAANNTVSTFGLDVDDASYRLALAHLGTGQLPPTTTVRIEEFVNSFDMEYPEPAGTNVAMHLDAMPSPFNEETLLVRIGVQAMSVDPGVQPPLFLIYVVDVSGSMALDNRLNLVKESLLRLTNLLRPEDQVAIVAYHAEAAIPLPPTLVSNGAIINDAIINLRTSGTSNTQTGLESAYQIAGLFGAGRQTQLLLFSDGLTNLGAELAETIVAAGSNSLPLHTFSLALDEEGALLMEDLAVQGNGNHSLLATMSDIESLFAATLPAALLPVARNAAVQVVFQPEVVANYRLLGFDNRLIDDDTFRMDSTEGGELGSGHAATAIYEIELAAGADPAATAFMVTLRYEDPVSGSDYEQVMTFRPDQATTITEASPTLRLAALASHFGLWLKGEQDEALGELLETEMQAMPWPEGQQEAVLSLLYAIEQALAVADMP